MRWARVTSWDEGRLEMNRRGEGCLALGSRTTAWIEASAQHYGSSSEGRREIKERPGQGRSKTNQATEIQEIGRAHV